MEKTSGKFDEENIEFLRRILGNEKIVVFFRVSNNIEEANEEDEYTYQEVKAKLELMETSKENKWWLSTDKKVLAYNQLMNRILMVSTFNEFRESVQLLLGRHVWVEEFFRNYESLQAEAERVFKEISQN